MLKYYSMTIAEAREKCKIFIARVPRDVLIIVVLILASSASFGFGYLAGSTSSPQAGLSPEVTAGKADGEGNYVASKNGTKYYLPSCAGANQISDANKVWFVSASAAEAAGYSPAANCK
jgi:hypothetical protein